MQWEYNINDSEKDHIYYLKFEVIIELLIEHSEIQSGRDHIYIYVIYIL